MITLSPTSEILKINEIIVPSFTIPSITFQAWGTIVAIGVILALLLIYKKAKQKKVYHEINGLIFLTTLFALIGARIAYIAINLGQFSDFMSMMDIWEGGLIGWGAILGGILGILIFKISTKIKSKDLFYLLELMAPYIALAFAIGRIGCFVRGCCFGIPTNLPWGILYTGNSHAAQAGILTAVHPTQIYHAILDFIIFIILLKANKRKETLEKKNKLKNSILGIGGFTFLLFLMLYSTERFFIDFLRWHPASEYIGTLTITQTVYFFVFVIAFLLTRKIKKKNK